MPWFVTVQLTVAVPLILLNWYVGRRCARALAALNGWSIERLRRRLLIGALYLNVLPVAAAAAFLIGGRSATQAFAGESALIDAFLVYPFWTWLVILVQSAFLLAIVDCGALIRRWVKGVGSIGGIAHSRIVVALVGCAILYSTSVIVIETSGASVRTLDVEVPEFASRLDGFTILQISDVQGDGRTTREKIATFIAKANALRPDLILNGGDIITSGEKYIASTAALLKQLKAPYGHFAAVGDHDIFSNKMLVMDELRAAGIRTWDDTSLVLSVRDVPVRLSLVTYTYRSRPDSSMLSSLLHTPDGEYHIVVSHQPARHLVPRAAKSGVHLFLAGHTHGGGIAFGIPGIALLAPSSFETPYLSGRYNIGSMVVNVTNGLGFTLAPIRFHAPLEICLIRLRSPVKTPPTTGYL